jgi:glycosyltransferase involved in cell wall biosynthesis
MKTPRVSIILPTYNHAAYIDAALDSVFAQTYKDFEVIVVNDNSPDNTDEILSKYQNKIRYEKNQKNNGIAFTKNRGVALARGEYIAILDSDDIWFHNNIRKKVDFLDKHPKILAVCSDFEVFGDINVKSSFDSRGLFNKKTIGEDFIIKDTLGLLIDQCFMFSPTVLLRRESFEKYGKFEVSGSEDYEFFLRLAQNEDFGCIKEVLVKKREHAGNYSKNPMTNYTTRITALERIAKSPIISWYYRKKALKRISESYFGWAYWLLKRGYAKDSREKAMLSSRYSLNLKALKIILVSYVLGPQGRKNNV